MRRLFIVTVVTAVMVLSLFGCSEPSENGQNDLEGQNVFIELEDIKIQSSQVENALTELLEMEEGVVVNRYKGTFAFGDVSDYDNEFEKIDDNNYHIIYTAIDKDGNREVKNVADGTAENVFENQLMVEGFQKILGISDKLEITKEDSGSVFKYYYPIGEIEEADSFDFVGIEAYYLYFLDENGGFTGVEQHAVYEINDGEEHHDFVKTTISETLI